MNHIDEFVIGGFRGLQDLKIEGLSQINLLVGGTNTGKTSVLEALSIYCDPLNWRTWYNSAVARELIGGFGGSLMQTWLFPQGNDTSLSDHKIALSAVGKLPVREISARYTRFTEIMQNVAKVDNKLGTVEWNDVEVQVIGINISAFINENLIEKDLNFSDNQFFRYENEQESPNKKHLRKPIPREKAVVGCIVGVLKPGKTNTVSIADDDWVCERTIRNVDEVSSLHNFVKTLLEIT